MEADTDSNFARRESEQTSSWCLIAREAGEGKQMTAYVEHPETDRPRSSAGAPPAGTESQTDRPAMAIETARYPVTGCSGVSRSWLSKNVARKSVYCSSSPYCRKQYGVVKCKTALNELDHRAHQEPLRGLSRMRGNRTYGS